MVHEERRLIDGHVCEIKGSDHQIYVDGECVTDEVLAQLGGIKEDGHGLREPYSNGEVFTAIDVMLRMAEQEADADPPVTVTSRSNHSKPFWKRIAGRIFSDGKD